MSEFASLTTKKARREFILAKVTTDPRWMVQGLITIFEHQTQDEQNSDTTNQHNGVGFSSFDAEIMSSIAKRAINKGLKNALRNKQPIILGQYFSPREEEIIKKRMTKYAGQLARFADQKQPLVKKAKAQ